MKHVVLAKILNSDAKADVCTTDPERKVNYEDDN